MTWCPSVRKIIRVSFIFLPAVLGLVLLSGCDTDGYSEDWRYPVRTDPLILAVPTDKPAELDTPGQFPHSIDLLADKEMKDAGAKTLDPDKLSASDRADLNKALEDYFGTPAHPAVNKIESSIRSSLQLDDNTLAKGSLLYRRHCLHCHGLSGDGRGPTAPWVNPHPRDYRPGKFKFLSSEGGNNRKPRREDLLRTLRNGIEGTSMPPFGLLPDEQLQALASYVIHLSLRGQTEFDTIRALLGETARQSDEGSPVAVELAEYVTFYAKTWLDSQGQVVTPPTYQTPATNERLASVARGAATFQEKGCLGCHLDYGRRDNYKFDEWGTVVRPANLTAGNFRGGRRPLDIYWRINTGIMGAQMPAFTENDKIWDLVNFVLAVPYPDMLPPDVREQVYPSAK